MSLRQMDLNLFVVFDAIYRERHLTRAAEQLAITQPGISNALNRLRQRFDDPLFVRTGRTMVPTPVAEGMIGPVRQALRQLDGCITGTRNFDPASAEKTFTISMPVLDSVAILPRLMTRLAEVAPGIRLKCLRIPRKQVVRQLSDGQVDLATDVDQLAGPPLMQAPLMQVRYMAVMRPDHPMADEALTLDRYLASRHIIVSHRASGASHVEAALSRLGHRQNSVLRLQSYHEAFEVVATTDMILAAPDSLLSGRGFATQPLPFPVAPLPMALYWHSRADADPANRWLRNLILGLS